MKKQIVFIGGGNSYGTYEDYINALKHSQIRNLVEDKPKRWTDELRKDLGEGYELYNISMPNTDNAVYNEWKICFEKYFKYINNGVTLIGWSLGGMFLAKYLTEHETPFAIQTLLLLASPCGEYNDESGNNCGTFRFEIKQLSKLSDRVNKIILMHSKDDFVVEYNHVLQYKKEIIEATLITFENKNHFLIETFPEIVSLLKKSE